MGVSQQRMGPEARTNPSGRRVWRARPRDADGNRVVLGTYARKGPCDRPGEDCCCQHALDVFYARRMGSVVPDTFGAYAEVWLERHPGRSARTEADYRSKLRVALRLKVDGAELREWRIGAFTTQQANSLRHEMLAAGWSPGYAINVLRRLHTMCEDAMNDGRTAANPFHGATRRLQRAVRDRPDEWVETDAQVYALAVMHNFCAAAGGHEPMLRCLVDWGLRVGELFALKRVEQDIARGVWRVSGTAWDGKWSPSTREKRHDRSGPMTAETQAMLRALPPRLGVPWLFPTPGNVQTRKPRIDWPPHAFLASMVEEDGYAKTARRLGVSDNALRKHLRNHAPGVELAAPTGGALWRYDNWRRDVWLPTCAAAGISPRPKDFRASLNQHLRESGVDREERAAFFGHDPDVNERSYTRSTLVNPDAIKALIG